MVCWLVMDDQLLRPPTDALCHLGWQGSHVEHERDTICGGVCHHSTMFISHRQGVYPPVQNPPSHTLLVEAPVWSSLCVPDHQQLGTTFPLLYYTKAFSHSINKGLIVSPFFGWGNKPYLFIYENSQCQMVNMQVWMLNSYSGEILPN